MILKESVNGFAREALRRAKYICPALMNMDQPPVRGSDLQTAIAITKQPSAFELRHSVGERIRLDLSVDESSDSELCADQECAVITFTETLDAVGLAGQGIEFWRMRFPSPQPLRHPYPEITLAVLI